MTAMKWPKCAHEVPLSGDPGRPQCHRPHPAAPYLNHGMQDRSRSSAGWMLVDIRDFSEAGSRRTVYWSTLMLTGSLAMIFTPCSSPSQSPVRLSYLLAAAAFSWTCTFNLRKSELTGVEYPDLDHRHVQLDEVPLQPAAGCLG